MIIPVIVMLNNDNGGCPAWLKILGFSFDVYLRHDKILDNKKIDIFCNVEYYF